MKKYVIGIFIGFCLSFAVGAHAEVSSFVGRVIEGAFPVKYNNATIGDGLVVDGTTYLPVRKLGEAMGLTVSFDADLGVSLTNTVTYTTYTSSKEVQPVVTIPNTTQSQLTPEQKIEKLQGFDSQIESAKTSILGNQRFIDNAKPNDPRINEIEGYIQRSKDKIADLERQKAALYP